MTMDPREMSPAEALVAAVCRQLGTTPDPETLSRVAAVVAQALADGAVLDALDISADEPPAACRPQDL